MATETLYRTHAHKTSELLLLEAAFNNTITLIVLATNSYWMQCFVSLQTDTSCLSIMAQVNIASSVDCVITRHTRRKVLR